MNITLQEPIKTLKRYCRLKQYATLKERIEAVVLASEGESIATIAKRIDRGVTFVKTWVNRYGQQGILRRVGQARHKAHRHSVDGVWLCLASGRGKPYLG